MEREAWIIDGVRTPRGKGKAGGALNHIHPQELLAQCLNGLVARTSIDPLSVDDVVIGNGMNSGDHGACIGRLALLTAGWPAVVPGFTLNRHCGSGQQAVTVAAMGVLSGMYDLVVAGGVESMSRWPAPDIAEPPTIDGRNSQLRDTYPLVPQGVAADLIATVEGFSRESCDRLAVTSQGRCNRALSEGRFDRSLIEVRNPDGTVALGGEEHPRASTTLEALARLAPAFADLGRGANQWFAESFDEMCMRVYPVDHIDHVHHAGNSSGVVDGACTLLVASSDFARANGLVPRARIRSTAVAGSDPVMMLTAPGPASKKCLDKARMNVADIDLWEINEAFSAVVLKAMRDLDLDPERVNPNGGAIALGHPIGATGGMLILTAIDELERGDGTTALVTMCTGGGMGTATVLERM